MTYSAASSEIVMPMVGPLGPWGIIISRPFFGTSGPVSATWDSSNRAVYHPVIVPVACPVRRLWWTNGATVSTSYNVDCGIYRDASGVPGARIVSTGSTQQGTASQVQFVDVADVMLSPGVYWVALVCSTDSATFYRTPLTGTSSGPLASVARLRQENALPLPATATPIQSGTGYIYLCGFATTASP